MPSSQVQTFTKCLQVPTPTSVDALFGVRLGRLEEAWEQEGTAVLLLPLLLLVLVLLAVAERVRG